MSNAYRIHGARFLRKYSASDRSSIYSYMADVRKIANTLCKVPWTRVKSDIAATTTIHTEEGLDWNEPERDRFDAAEWCGEHSDGFHRAFAQAACYVFKLPTSAIGTEIEKIRLQVTSDAYNPYGARIAAMTSETLDIPMDCDTVRQGEVFRAPGEDGMGAAPRLYLRNKDGSQQWYSNTELVELTPETPLSAKQFLFVFVCLENYNRGRDGWIEGSSYIDNDVEVTLGAACEDLVEDELNDCSSVEKFRIIRFNHHDHHADGYSVIGYMDSFEGREMISGHDYFKMAMGTPNADDFGIFPGLKIISSNQRGPLSAGSVYHATGTSPAVAPVGSLRSICIVKTENGATSGLDLAWVDDEYFFNVVSGIVKTQTGYDMTGATFSRHYSIPYPVKHVEISATSEGKFFVVFVDSSGLLHQIVFNPSDASTVCSVFKVDGSVGSVFKVGGIGIGICGDFTKVGSSDISRFACSATGTDFTSIFSDFAAPVLDDYTGFSIGGLVDQSRVSSFKALVSGNFKKVDGVDVDGRCYFEKVGEVLIPVPLRKMEYVISPDDLDKTPQTGSFHETGVAVIR